MSEAAEMPSVRFGDCTFLEIRQRAQAGWLAVVPTGCTEQQGPHLTVDFDTAGAMHTSNEMIWFHNDEISGFPEVKALGAPVPLPVTGGTGSPINWTLLAAVVGLALLLLGGVGLRRLNVAKR